MPIFLSQFGQRSPTTVATCLLYLAPGTETNQKNQRRLFPGTEPLELLAIDILAPFSNAKHYNQHVIFSTELEKADRGDTGRRSITRESHYRTWQ